MSPDILVGRTWAGSQSEKRSQPPNNGTRGFLINGSRPELLGHAPGICAWSRPFNLFVSDLGEDREVYKTCTSHKLTYWVMESKFKMIPTNLNSRLNKAQEFVH